MNIQRLIYAMLALAAAVVLMPVVRAQTLDLTLLDANQTVTQGTTVVAFDATLFNPTATTIYLNDGSGTSTSPFLSVDLSPFFANAPLSLAPDQDSGPFELFAVDLAGNTLTGSYSGNSFQIQGGADGGSFTAFSGLADASFTVTVKGSTQAAPEIDPTAAMSGIGSLLLALAIVRDRRTPRATS